MKLKIFKQLYVSIKSRDKPLSSEPNISIKIDRYLPWQHKYTALDRSWNASKDTLLALSKVPDGVV